MNFDDWWNDLGIKAVRPTYEIAKDAWETARAEGAPSQEAQDAARYVMDNARDYGENETIIANEIVRLAMNEDRK